MNQMKLLLIASLSTIFYREHYRGNDGFSAAGPKGSAIPGVAEIRTNIG
jgi:hypothetical protein